MTALYLLFGFGWAIAGTDDRPVSELTWGEILSILGEFFAEWLFWPIGLGMGVRKWLVNRARADDLDPDDPDVVDDGDDG